MSIGILVWVVATSDMIRYAVLITAGVFVVALAYLGWATWLTGRRDRVASLQSGGGRP
jgi:hypothetical protein